MRGFDKEQPRFSLKRRKKGQFLAVERPPFNIVLLSPTKTTLILLTESVIIILLFKNLMQNLVETITFILITCLAARAGCKKVVRCRFG